MTLLIGLVSELPQPIQWNSEESDLGCTSREYVDYVTLTLHIVTMMSQNTCQYNNTFNISVINGYNIPQDALNGVFFQ